jgi:hypothetical protein
VTEHQKLATLLIRIFGAGLAGLMALSFLVYGVEQLFALPVKATPLRMLLVDGWYLLLGVLLVVTSKRTGKLLGSGLG